MLHTMDKAASSSDGQVFANPTYQNDAASPSIHLFQRNSCFGQE